MTSPQPTSSTEVRLLPLTEGAPNEALANTLARLLIDDPQHADLGAEAALLILTGIQMFIDSGGDYLVVERLWEPTIVLRHLQKTCGDGAFKKALEMAAAADALKDSRGAAIYRHVAIMLCPAEVNKPVDSASESSTVQPT